MTQLYRIVDSLLDTRDRPQLRVEGRRRIPPRTLPPKALVLALTPLLDERAVGALLDLRARGFDLAVVEVSPVPFVVRGPTGARAARVRDLEASPGGAARPVRAGGVPVAVWNDEAPLMAALEEVRAFRRYARPVHA